jgi:hypothetical protein
MGTGNAGTPGVTGTAGTSSGPADPNAAGLMPLRRLTNREYNNTVRDLLGEATHPANKFPTDRDKTFEFRRAGDLAVQDATRCARRPRRCHGRVPKLVNDAAALRSRDGRGRLRAEVRAFGQRLPPRSRPRDDAPQTLYTAGARR